MSYEKVIENHTFNRYATVKFRRFPDDCSCVLSNSSTFDILRRIWHICKIVKERTEISENERKKEWSAFNSESWAKKQWKKDEVKWRETFFFFNEMHKGDYRKAAKEHSSFSGAESRETERKK